GGKLPALDGSDLTNLDADKIATGTLPVGRGGTGATSFAADAVIISNITGTGLQALNCTSGQVLKFGVTGNAYCGTDDTGGSGNEFSNNGNSFAADASLGTNDNFNLNFKTNGMNRMTILSDGNIGVGTGFPSSEMHILSGANSFPLKVETSSFLSSGIQLAN